MTTVYFATNRSLVKRGGRSEIGTAFNVDGPAALRFGRAEVTGDAYDQFDVHVAPEKLSGTLDPPRKCRHFSGIG